MIDCNLTLSYCDSPKMATVNFRRLENDVMFEDVEKVLRSSGRYSPFIFTGDYRSSDNYIKCFSNCIVLDFDDGYTMEEFKESADFAYAIGTTKSHNKEKNGIVCDRFRVIIPTLTAIDLDQIGVSALMTEIFNIYPMADTSCKDSARAYAGYQESDVYIHYGKYFDWEPLYKKYLDRIEVIRRWQEKERAKVEQREFTEDDIKSAMKSRFERLYTIGNRNNTVADIVLWAKKEGFTQSDTEELIVNLVLMSGDPLPDKEVLQILKYHFRR